MAPAQDPAPDLTAALSSLWPGAHVRAGHDPRALAQFVPLPRASAPRVLVPVGHPRAAARSLLRFSADSSAGDLARRSAGAAWLLAGGLRGLQRLSVDGDRAGSMQAHLSQLLGTEVIFSLTLGTARVNRKPVLQVFDEDGTTLAFAKLGDTPQSRQDVVAEARALRDLAGRAWQELDVPRVLHLGRWDDILVLLLSPLAARPRTMPVGPARPPLRAMRELEAAYAEEPAPLDELPWLARIRTTAEALRDQPQRRQLQHCVDVLVEEAARRPVPVSAWHGDWTPWNMSGGRGAARVWDWERFETGVPSRLDPIHFEVNVATRARGTSVATIVEALGCSGTSADDRGSEAHLRAGLYLLAVAARYLPLAEGARGADIAPRARCVLDALAAWTGAGQGSGSTGDPTAASR